MKKNFFYIFMYFFCVKTFATDFCLEQLWILAEKNNPEIIAADFNYKNATLSRKGLNASYFPSLVIETTTANTEKYEWNKIPDSFGSSVSIKHSLPGGTTLGVTGSYSFVSADISQNRFVSQKPSVIFSVSQSLLPFWIQGSLNDPVKMSLEQQKQYYFNQLIYIKKQVLQDLIQYYFLSLIYCKQIGFYQNSILFVEEQVKNLQQMQKIGATNTNQILELEMVKLNHQQDKAEAESNFSQCMQFLENICCTRINFKDVFENSSKKFSSDIDFLQDNPLVKLDPYKQLLLIKIKMVESSIVLKKQSAAPVLNLFFSPEWQLEPVLSSNLKKAWNSGNSNWTAGLSVDFSPWITYAAKNESEKNSIELSAAENSYNSYLIQKENIKNYYLNLSRTYFRQKEDIEKICMEIEKKLEDIKKQLDSGAISVLDYKSVVNQYEKSLAMLYCAEKYFELYKSLQKLYE